MSPPAHRGASSSLRFPGLSHRCRRACLKLRHGLSQRAEEHDLPTKHKQNTRPRQHSDRNAHVNTLTTDTQTRLNDNMINFTKQTLSLCSKYSCSCLILDFVVVIVFPHPVRSARQETKLKRTDKQGRTLRQNTQHAENAETVGKVQNVKRHTADAKS